MTGPLIAFVISLAVGLACYAIGHRDGRRHERTRRAACGDHQAGIARGMDIGYHIGWDARAHAAVTDTDPADAAHAYRAWMERRGALN